MKCLIRAAAMTHLFVLAALSWQVMSKAQSSSGSVPAEWQTHAEQSNYRETPRYDATIAYARRLAAASPLIILTEFGKSGEGRSLPLIVAARGATFTPDAARRANKAVVLVQACIHAGEPDGKDAGLALLRDIAITKTQVNLLDRVVLLFIPIYNPDGHERFGPHNRINQNGPVEMGWRGNATNLNLNRDYMKADAPETRAWLRLWRVWNPDLFVDCHVTDGADFQYNITYQHEQHENVAAPIRNWAQKTFEHRVAREAEKNGNLLSPYLVLRNHRDLEMGVEAFISTPRFATGYVPLTRNRPALLIETHSLKEYRARVRGTYDVLRATLEEANRDAEGLMRAVRLADEQVIAEGSTHGPTHSVALQVALTDKSVPFNLKGVAYRKELSEVSGDVRIVYGTKPADITVPFYTQARPIVSVSPPLYYLVPPQWKGAIEVLAAHGLLLKRLAEPLTIEVEQYRFSEVKWAPASFEGRLMPRYKTELSKAKRTFPANSLVVPVGQAAGRVALHLLEPEAPDALVAWGFFNSIFEQKEYAEAYVLENLAREMLARDPELKRVFEERIARDPDFARTPAARLSFFYDKSPYRDAQLNWYPVARLITPLTARVVNYEN